MVARICIVQTTIGSKILFERQIGQVKQNKLMNSEDDFKHQCNYIHTEMESFEFIDVLHSCHAVELWPPGFQYRYFYAEN